MPNGPPSFSRCPNCGVEMAPRDIICVECGLNVITRQKLRPERFSVGARLSDFVATKSNLVFTLGIVVLLILLALVWYAASRDYLTEGRRLYEAKSWEDAEQALHKAIERKPNSSLGHYYLGMLYSRRQALGMAVQEFQQSVTLDDSFQPAKMMLGVTAGLSGDLERSTNALREVDPTFPRGAGLYGLSLLARGDFNSAMEPLKTATQLEPSEEMWKEALATAYIQAGTYAEAEAVLRVTSVGGVGGSRAFLLRALNESIRGSESQAVDLLKTAAREQPSDESLRFLGIAQVASGDYEAGLQTIRSMIPRFSRDAELRFFYGSCLAAMGNWDQAILELERVVGVSSPYEAAAENQLGLAYLMSGSAAEAISHLERAADLEGRNPHFQYTLGLAYQTLEQDSRALQKFKQAAQLDSNTAEPHLAFAGHYALQARRNPRLFADAASELRAFVAQAGRSVDTRSIRNTIEALDILTSQQRGRL